MFSSSVSPLPPDDEQLRLSLADAEFPALLAAVAHATGDLTVLRPELRPERARLREPNAGLSPDQLSVARDVGFVLTLALRQSVSIPPVTSRIF